MRIIQYLAVAASALLPVQPCLAADDFRDFAVVERRSAAFAGVRLRLPLGAGNPERPSARLQLTSFHDYRDAGGALVRSHRAPGVELGLNPSGRISYHVGGTDVAVTRERLRASGGTTTWIIVGGIVVAVVILAAVVSAQPTAGPPEGAFD